jgi:hypothetical protein
VKTATRKYSIQLMKAKTIAKRGEWMSFTHDNANGEVGVMALVWADRERRYFISTASSAAAGASYETVRWRQVPDGPQRQTLTVEQTKVAEIYYSACAQIDKHNRCRQADLGLERAYVTHDWSMRTNFSLLGMLVVDTWLLYTGARGRVRTMVQSEFYEALALDLIDNNFEQVGLRKSTATSTRADFLFPSS